MLRRLCLVFDRFGIDGASYRSPYGVLLRPSSQDTPWTAPGFISDPA